MRQHDHLNDVRQNLRDNFQYGSVLPSDLGYGLGGWQGVDKYIIDYSTLTTAGMTGNLAVTYLGSYDVDYKVMSIDRNANSAIVKFTITNSSTAASGFRPPVIGYTFWWQQNVGKNLNKWFSSVPMSETKQTFIWTETISW